MARKVKMNFETILENFQWFNRERVKTQKGMASAFWLEKRLTEAQKEFIKTFPNTDITTVSYRYAPEIKHDVLLQFDKCIK